LAWVAPQHLPLCWTRCVDEAEARELAAQEIQRWQAEYDRIDALKRAAGLATTADMEVVMRGLEPVPVVALVTTVERVSRTWCLAYADRRFLETGDVLYAMVGAGPVLVGETGAVRVARSALSLEQNVREFEKQETG